MDITRWSLFNIKIKLIIFFAAKDGEDLYSQQKQDQELTVAQVMKSLLQSSDLIEESRENTRPFRYDLNEIPYDYTVEVTNRFKGLDLIDRVPEELWMEVCDIVQEAVIKTIQMQKAKWLSEEALQIAEKRREAKGKVEKGIYTHLNVEFQRIARRDKKAFLREEIEEKQQNGND